MKRLRAGKAAKVQKSNNSNLILLIVLISISFTAAVVFWKESQAGKISKLITPNLVNPKTNISPTPTNSYQIDNENDGVYTDLKYGVYFVYPSEIFKYQKNLFEEGKYRSIYWDKLEDGSSYLGANKDGADLDFIINGLPYSFDKLYNSQEGVMLPKGFAGEHKLKKIRNLKISGGYRGIVYDIFPEIIDTPAITYRAAWKKGDNTFWLTVSTNNKNESMQYKKIFDDIISSFEFF